MASSPSATAPDQQFKLNLFPTANLNARNTPVTTTVLANIWCLFIKEYPDVALQEFEAWVRNDANLAHVTIRLPVDKNETADNERRLSADDVLNVFAYENRSGKSLLRIPVGQRTPYPEMLWRFLFTGLFQIRPSKLKFLHFINTDGFKANGLFANLTRHTARTSNAATNRNFEPIGFHCRDFRSKTTKSLSEIVGRRSRTKRMGLSSVTGFKGIIRIDKDIAQLNQGVDVVKELYENHNLIFADLGVVDHMSMIAVDATVTLMENKNLKIDARWINRSFGSGEAYARKTEFGHLMNKADPNDIS